LCQSHGLCVEVAPAVFEIRDDGFLYVLDDEPTDSATKRTVEKAIVECPTAAITWEG
jgi:ferredoxin